MNWSESASEAKEKSISREPKQMEVEEKPHVKISP